MTDNTRVPKGALTEEQFRQDILDGLHRIAESGLRLAGHHLAADLVSAPCGGAAADEPCSFTDAGAAPLTLLDTSSQRAPANLSEHDLPSDLAASLNAVEQRSEGKEIGNGS